MQVYVQTLFHLFLLDSSFPLDIFPIDINIQFTGITQNPPNM